MNLLLELLYTCTQDWGAGSPKEGTYLPTFFGEGPFVPPSERLTPLNDIQIALFHFFLDTVQ
jgi:hypothetical protein